MYLFICLLLYLPSTAISLTLSDAFTNSAVYLAASQDAVGILERLLDLGRNIESLGENGQTALMGAAASGSMNSFKLLMKRGANIHAQSLSFNETTLHIAVRFDQLSIIRYLLDQNLGDLIDVKDIYGNTALNDAVIYGRENVFELLLAKGASMESRNRIGRTPLLNACAYGHLPILQLLVKSGADLNAKSGAKDQQNTAIHLASYYGHHEIVAYLLNQYPDFISAKNANGETALYLGAYMGHEAVTKILLENSHSIQLMKDPGGLTPLMIAVGFNRLNVVQTLNSVSQDDMDRAAGLEDSIDAMHSAARYGHTVIMEHLISSNQALLEATDANNSTPLDKAATVGNIQSVKFLIRHGADIQASNYQGRSPFLSACANGQLPVVEYLQENGAKVYAKDSKGQLCVHLAAMNGHLDVLKYLLTIHLDMLEERNSNGETPLIIAARYDQSSIIEVLVSHYKANLEARDFNSYTPLISAVASGRLSAVQALCSLGASVKAAATVDDYDTSVHIAARNNHVEVLVYLVSNGRELIDLRNKRQDTPICVGAKSGHIDVVERLLTLGGLLESRCFNDSTPLILSSVANKSAMVEYLLQKGANILAKSNTLSEGNTAVHFAAQLGYLNVLNVLLANSKSIVVEVKNVLGQTALWKAAFAGHEACVQFLLSRNASIGSSDLMKRTPLHAAVIANQPRVVKVLLDYRADTTSVTHPRDFSLTPLVYAAKLGFTDVIKVLLTHNPSLIEQTCPNGENALCIAAAEGHESAVEFLLMRNALIEAKCLLQRTALLEASANGHVEVAKSLLRKGANIWARSSVESDNGNTAAHLAAIYGHSSILRLLISSERSMLETSNKLGFTPLYLAAQNGHDSATEYLLEESATCSAQGALGYSPFIAAADSNKLNVIKVMINRGAGVYSKTNVLDGENMAIHKAAEKGHTDIVKFLLEDKPDLVRAINKFGDTPLIIASAKNNLETVETLLKFNSVIEARGNLGWTAFMAASASGHLRMVQFLYSKGNANASAKSNAEDDERLAIHLASYFGHLDVIRYLVEENLNLIDIRTKSGNTAIWLSSSLGHLEVVQWLLNKSVDIETAGLHGWTPLLSASANGHLNVVQLLVANGANLSARSDQRNRASLGIHLSAENGHVNVLKYYIENRRNMMESRNLRGWTPLLASCAAGKLSSLHFLIASGANVMAKSYPIDGGNSAFHLTAIYDHQHLFKTLYNAGGRKLLESRNHNNEQPLWRAAQLGNLASVQHLLELGAPIDVQCSFGWTALAASAAANRGSVTKRLLQSGAKHDLSVFSLDANTAVHLACLYGRLESLRAFLKAEVSLHKPNSFGENCLFQASYGGAKAAISFLIDADANVNIRGRLGWSPLHAASANGHLPSVKFLLEKSIPADVRSSEVGLNAAPIHISASAGHGDVTAYFGEINSLLLEIRDLNNNTALWRASFANRTNVVSALLQIKASPIAVGENSWTPFHAAAAAGNLKVMSIFLQNDPSILNVTTPGEKSMAIHIASRLGRDASVAFLLNAHSQLVEVNDAYGNAPLWIASYFGQFSTVKLLISRGAHVESKGRYGWTPLIAASSNNMSTIVEYLLNEGQAELTAVSDAVSGENSALHVAAMFNCLDVTQVLVAHQMKNKRYRNVLEMKNRNGNTALWLAAAYGHSQIVKFLISVKADFNVIGDAGYSPLVVAVVNSKLSSIKTLLEKGADIRYGDLGENVLHLAVQRGLVDVAELLVQSNPSLLDSVDRENETPAYKAASAGHVGVLSLLLRKGANITIANRKTYSPFTAAAISGQVAAMEELLNSGKVKFDARDSTGRTPLQWAIFLGRVPAVQLLVKKGADLRDRSTILEERGAMAIHSAALLGHLEVVRFLLDVDRSLVEAKTSQGETALFYASRQGNLQIVKFLLSYRAQTEVRNIEGRTVLLEATLANKLEVVRLLIENGANKLAEDSSDDGNNALHIAAEKGYLPLVDYLSTQISRVSKNSKNRTPLWLSSYHGHFATVQFLSNFRNEVDIDAGGSTPLHAACLSGHLNIVDLLLQRGADMTTKTSPAENSESPIHLAIRSGSLDLIKFILRNDFRKQLELTNKDNVTPLCLSCAIGRDDIVKYFLSLGANIEARCESTWTPLMTAAFGNYLQVVRVLVDSGASILAKQANNFGSNTAFHVAAKNGSSDVLKYFLQMRPQFLEENNLLGDTPLFIASAEGKIKAISFLVGEGANLEARLSGKSPIWQAASNGHVQAVKLLVLSGANFEARGVYGRTPLLEAAVKCRTDVVKYLVDEAGADVMAHSGSPENGNTVVHLATVYNCTDVIKLVIDRWPSIVQARNFRGQSAQFFIDSTKVVRAALENEMLSGYFSAAEIGDVISMKVILKSNAVDLFAKTSSFNGAESAVHIAARNGHLGVVQFLVEANSTFLKLRSKSGDSALHVAAFMGRNAIVEYLLKNGAKLEARNVDGLTPFLSAVAGGRREVMHIFMSKKARLTVRTKAGENALHLAAKLGRDWVVDEIFETKLFSIDDLTRRLETPLYLASKFGHLSIVHNLLRRKSKLDATDVDGVTPFMISAAQGHAEVMQYLIEKGANVNSQTKKDGYFATHLTVKNDQLYVLEELIRRFPNLTDAKSHRGETCLYLAAYTGNQMAITELLEGGRSNISARCQDGLSPFHIAVVRNRIDTVKRMRSLVKVASALLNDPVNNSQRDLAVHLAAIYGHLDLLRYLIEMHKTIDVRNVKGQTPLWRAAFVGKIESVELLLQHGADFRALDAHSLSPLDAASSNGHLEVTKLIAAKLAAPPIAKMGIQPNPPAVQFFTQSLQLAAERGHLEVVKYFLEKQPQLLESKSTNNETALWRASFAGQEEVAKSLIAHGANVHASNVLGQTPLHAAALNNMPRMVELLLLKRADILATTSDDAENLPVHVASARGNVEAVQELVENLPALVESANREKATPLCIAAQFGHVRLIRYLLSQNASVDKRCRYGWSPMLFAVANNQLESVKELLNSGASISLKSNEADDGDSAIHLSCKFGLVEMTAFLLSKRPNFLEETNAKGNSPLYVAASNGHLPVVDFLVDEKKANIHSRGERSLTPFLAAASNNKPLVMQFFIERGNDLDETTEDGLKNQAIHIASSLGHVDAVRYLIRMDHGLLEALNAHNESPLWLASQGGHLGMIKYLLDSAANINHQNRFGLTPLHAATVAGKRPAVELLIEKGADMLTVTYASSDKLSVMHLAAAMNLENIIRLLYKIKPGMLEMKSASGESPLYYATYRGAVTSVRLLLSLGADRSTRCDAGWTPLIVASYRNNVELIELLLTNGASIDEKIPLEGNYAIHIAALFGRFEAVKRLATIRSLVDRKNSLGESALWKAAYAGQFEVVDFLTNYDACCNLEILGRNLMTPLHAAVYGGHLEVVKLLVRKGASLLSRTADRIYSPIQLAASLGELEIVRFLVDHRNDLLEIDRNIGATPLLVAIQHGQAEIVRLLISLGANVESRGPFGRTSIHLASSLGHLSIVKILREAGADISARSQEADNNRLAIHGAVEYNQFDVVNYLLKEKPSLISAKDKNGADPLWLAASRGNLTMVIMLVSKGAIVESTNNLGWTPLMTASWRNHLLVVKYLVTRAKAKLFSKSIRSDNENTALHLAVINNSFDVVLFLVRHQKSLINDTNANGNVALWLASFHGRHEIVRLLLAVGSPINRVGEFGWSPLMAAASRNHLKVVKLLKNAGADVWIRSQDDSVETVIHIVSSRGLTDITAYLLKTERKLVEAKDSNDTTPLIRASQAGHLAIVRLLIENGAKITDKTKFGMTALMVAAKMGHAEIVSYLIQKGAPFQATDSDGRTPLLWACIEGSVPVIRALVVGGAEIRVRSDKNEDAGGMAIHLAATYGNVEAVEFLLQTDRNLLEAKNNQDKTPLLCACEFAQFKVAERLISAFYANINAKDLGGHNALLLSAQSGEINLVKLLASRGSSLESFSNDQNSGLHLAAKSGFVEVARYFGEARGGLLERRNAAGQTPLLIAASNGRVEVLNYLLSRYVRIDTTDNNGWMALHHAAAGGHVECMRSLLTRGATIQARLPTSADMPIHLAAANGHLNAVQFLVGVNARSQIESGNANSDTPLHLAASEGRIDIVRFLIAQRANLESRNRRQITPLMAAVIGNHLAIVKVLVEAGASVSAQSGIVEQRYSSVHFAASLGHLEILKYLLSVDGSLREATTSLGATPLSEASAKGQSSIVDFLARGSAELDGKTLNGLTPLWRAAVAGHAEVVKHLIDFGADVEAHGQYGRTALLASSAAGHLEVTKLLIEHGANFFAKSSDKADGGSTALHLAVIFNQHEVAQYLRQVRPALLNLRNAQWQTPLGVAQAENKKQMISILS